MSDFAALLLSLPSGNSTLRMRLWRALKATGCAVLRDGVYILPPHAREIGVLSSVEADVQKAGGSAMTVELTVKPSQRAQVQSLFDRTSEYTELVSRINATKAGLGRLAPRRAGTAYELMKRAFEEISAIDFYPGHARAQTLAALATLERSVKDAASGEPRRRGGKPRKLESASYNGRTWATRKDPWVDRLASAWLIKRFIDRDARFIWLDHPANKPRRALGFDFDGAEFTHSRDRVTFEVLRESFGLDSNPGLLAIGAAVHYLDVGGIAVPEAKGLEAVLGGIKGKARNDDARLREAMRVFDFLYSSYTQPGISRS